MNCDFAFPFLVKPGERIPNPGLTKREFFAGLICACACANPEIEAFAEPVRIVADSVAIADELIRQLNEREDTP